MTPDQEVTVLTTLARIDETTVASKATLDRHEGSINTLYSKVNATEKTLSRHKGIGVGVVGVFTALVAALKMDFWQ